MDKCWEMYENMQEVVYVSDMDTYEVIYINRYGREQFGVEAIADLAGRPCYEVIQDCSSPCSICNNSQLQPGQFIEWRHYNALVDKLFLIKDTMIELDGKRYKLEIAVDITEADQQHKTIEAFTSNEMMVNDALRLSLSEAYPEKAIAVLLKHLGQSLKSDRVYIFEELPNHVMRNTYEWCAGGVKPQKDFLQEVPFDVVALWYDSFRKNENIVVKSLESIRYTHPEAYATLLPQQVDSLVVSPLIFNGKIIGFYGMDNPPQEFLNHIAVLFMMLGHFIASLLRRRDLVERLEKLSFYDQLTGSLNRHGMNEFIDHVNPNASIGIVYCDLMGLKHINDTQGHTAGDAMLVRAYECLRSVFSANEVFRMGGDEFLVLSSTISQESLESKVVSLKNSMADYQVTFAVGSVWEDRCNDRITELMKVADQRMYADKAQYYSKQPFDRRNRR